jgi:hypothetical protein
MTLFQTCYEPEEWDLVSHRSEGEYFSVSEVSTDDEQEVLSSDPESEPPLVNFLEIKMFTSTFTTLPSLIAKRQELVHKQSQLTPGQFSLFDFYASRIDELDLQIKSLQQPSMVNIHNYTPTDADFVKSHKLKPFP